MSTFSHQFQVNAPLSAVVGFHRDTSILKRLTPLPVIVQLHRFEPLAEGSEAVFTMWFGPLPARWRAVHRNVGTHGFTDEQVTGPMQRWRHTHTFEPLGDTTTRVTDTINYAHQSGWRGWLTRLAFNRLSLQLLFTYRKWITRWHLLPSKDRRKVTQLSVLAVSGLVVAIVARRLVGDRR